MSTVISAIKVARTSGKQHPLLCGWCQSPHQKESKPSRSIFWTTSTSSSSVGIHGSVVGSVRRNMVLTPTLKQLSSGTVICVVQISCWLIDNFAPASMATNFRQSDRRQVRADLHDGIVDIPAGRCFVDNAL